MFVADQLDPEMKRRNQSTLSVMKEKVKDVEYRHVKHRRRIEGPLVVS